MVYLPGTPSSNFLHMLYIIFILQKSLNLINCALLEDHRKVAKYAKFAKTYIYFFAGPAAFASSRFP